MYSKTLKPLLLLALLVTLFSCSENEPVEETVEPEIPEQAEDTFNYIALRNDGTLFTIGDNTGKVVQEGRIPGIEFNTLFNSVTSSGSKIYIYEHRFDPPRGTLYAWDKQTGETESAILDFPEEFAENTALISLNWDEENQNLVGITRENFEEGVPHGAVKVVRINPENFQMVSQDIDLSTEGFEYVFSTSLVDQKLYAVATKDSRLRDFHLLELNLDQNSFQVLPLPGTATGIINIGNSGDANTLFGFSPVANSNIMAEVRPVTYDIQTGTLNELSEVPRLSAFNFSHKTFYNEEGEEFAYLSASNNIIYLFKYQPSTGDHDMVEINSDKLSTLISIVGVRKI